MFNRAAFEQKHTLNSNIVKYYNNLKEPVFYLNIF